MAISHLFCLFVSSLSPVSGTVLVIGSLTPSSNPFQADPETRALRLLWSWQSLPDITQQLRLSGIVIEYCTANQPIIPISTIKFNILLFMERHIVFMFPTSTGNTHRRDSDWSHLRISFLNPSPHSFVQFFGQEQDSIALNHAYLPRDLHCLFTFSEPGLQRHPHPYSWCLLLP